MNNFIEVSAITLHMNTTYAIVENNVIIHTALYSGMSTYNDVLCHNFITNNQTIIRMPVLTIYYKYYIGTPV